MQLCCCRSLNRYFCNSIHLYSTLIVIHPELISGRGAGRRCNHNHMMKTNVYIWCSMKLTCSMTVSMKAWAIPCWVLHRNAHRRSTNLQLNFVARPEWETVRLPSTHYNNLQWKKMNEWIFPAFCLVTWWTLISQLLKQAIIQNLKAWVSWTAWRSRLWLVCVALDAGQSLAAEFQSTSS